MNGGIKYFKLHSPYKGDETKNTSLLASDVDNNFFTLEGRDIQSIEVEGRDIVLTCLNGDKLVCEGAIPTNKSVSTIDFDEKKGVLTYVIGNETKEIYLGTAHSTAVDDTLSGNGTKANPISLARSMRPGQYRPVQKIVTGALDEACHCAEKFKPGDRILTIEGISDYGMLYNYEAVQKIACELLTANSPWRIPTKADWDDMLNAVEPCKDDMTHEIGTANRFLGHWAGKLLKSVDLWRTNTGCQCDCEEEDMPMFAVENDDKCNVVNPCIGDKFCGVASKPHHHGHKPTPRGGIDKYGFRVTPAGSATDDACNFLHFTERAIFWTATNIKGRNVYVKQFAYDRNDVLQDIVATGKYLSLRLVKDYNGSNFNTSEEILGQSYPTVLMPSKNKGASIWTSVNIAYNNCNLRALAPNNGLDLSETIHFFINEWDGEKWLRNEIKDGESVVVISTPEGEKYVEYEVIDNRLVNTNQHTFDKILDNVKETIENNNQVYESRITKLEEDTANFKEITNTNITNLNGKIDGIKEELEDKIKETEETAKENLETVKDYLTNSFTDGDQEISDRIDRLVDNIEKQNNSFTESIRATNEALTQTKEELDDSINRNRAELDKAIEDIANNVADKVKETSDSIKKALKESIDEIDEKYDEKTQKLSDEISNLSETVEENAKHLLVAEGTNYDPETGSLTLKTRGEDDIVVPMSFNFGTF